MGNPIITPHGTAKRPKRPTPSVSAAKKLAGGVTSMGLHSLYPVATLFPWLDAASAAQVDAIVASVVSRHPNLRAAILFGSIARHDERPLDDSEPSDVDLLLLFEPSEQATRLSLEERLAISHSIVSAMREHPDAPREVNVFTSATDLSEWHEDFVANLVQDGMALWAHRPLPALLAPVERRADVQAHATQRT